MEQAPKKGRIFYGWWVVAACFIVLMFHAGAAFYAYGRFQPTLIDVLGASKTAVSAAVSVYLLVLGLTGPIVGRLTEKYGPKLVLLIGGVIPDRLSRPGQIIPRYLQTQLGKSRILRIICQIPLGQRR